MSHQIVECPGCLTKLRVKESQAVINLACPRCGEQLAVDPPEPAQARQQPAPQRPVPQNPGPKRPATSAAPARSTRPPQQPAPSSAPRRAPPVNQPTFIQKNGLLIGILGGTGIGLLMLLTGILIFWKMQPATDANSVAQNQPPTGTTAQVVPDRSQTAEPGNSSTVPGDAGTPPVGTGPQNVPAPAIPATPANPATPAIPATPETPTPPIADGGNNNPGGNPGRNNSGGNANVAVRNGEGRKLMYEWKAGSEFVYRFSIEEGEGDASSKTTGDCTYHVEGAAGKSTEDQEGSGTGFVVAANGILATCAHVVEGVKRMEVNLGGQSYPATVLAVDAKSDVALIKINASGLPVLTVADSETVQLAESVRAIGFPLSDVLGTDVKVTTGTVAGIVQDKRRGKRIQIDAAINPGNSGGPVVNSSGQVVGVASAKLSGASVTAVGFAAPINQLRTLAATVNLQLPVAAKGQELEGTEVARRVTPAVAYIRVWGNSGGQLYNVAFRANFAQSQVFGGRMRRGFPMGPSFAAPSSDEGKLVVNGLGEVVQFNGREQLPAVLGPVGSFFLEPLDAYSESEWQTESETVLQRIKQDDNGPFGMGSPFGGRRRFGPPGFPDPFGRNSEPEVVETIPATRKTSYRVETTLNNKVSITKSYEMTATRSNGQSYMSIRGNGTVVFDTERGMPSSLEFHSRIQQNDDGKTIDVPVRITYTLRSIEEMQREREQAEADRKQREVERTTPNPEIVDEVLAQVKAQEGGSGAIAPLSRLGQLAVVDSKRDEVLRVMKNHMSNSNGFVRKSATEVFCLYATAEHLPELRQIVKDNDSLMIESRKRASQAIAKAGNTDDYPLLIGLVNDGFLRTDVKKVLISIGPAIEEPILKQFDSITDIFSRNELIDVLKKIGTSRSIPALEKLASDGHAKYNASQALDAIRARQ